MTIEAKKRYYFDKLQGNTFYERPHIYKIENYDEVRDRIHISWTHDGGGTTYHTAQIVIDNTKNRSWDLLDKRIEESYKLY